jgi:hypothetical protein
MISVQYIDSYHSKFIHEMNLNTISLIHYLYILFTENTKSNSSTHITNDNHHHHGILLDSTTTSNRYQWRYNRKDSSIYVQSFCYNVNQLLEYLQSKDTIRYYECRSFLGIFDNGLQPGDFYPSLSIEFRFLRNKKINHDKGDNMIMMMNCNSKKIWNIEDISGISNDWKIIFNERDYNNNNNNNNIYNTTDDNSDNSNKDISYTSNTILNLNRKNWIFSYSCFMDHIEKEYTFKSPESSIINHSSTTNAIANHNFGGYNYSIISDILLSESKIVSNCLENYKLNLINKLK